LIRKPAKLSYVSHWPGRDGFFFYFFWILARGKRHPKGSDCLGSNERKDLAFFRECTCSHPSNPKKLAWITREEMNHKICSRTPPSGTEGPVKVWQQTGSPCIKGESSCWSRFSGAGAGCGSGHPVRHIPPPCSCPGNFTPSSSQHI